MWSVVCSGTPLISQHFVCGCPEGLLDAENFGKPFLIFYTTADYFTSCNCAAGEGLAVSKTAFINADFLAPDTRALLLAILERERL